VANVLKQLINMPLHQPGWHNVLGAKEQLQRNLVIVNTQLPGTAGKQTAKQFIR
jgi:hypothetical protein